MPGAHVAVGVHSRCRRTLAWTTVPLASLAVTAGLVDPPAQGSPSTPSQHESKLPASIADLRGSRPNMLFVLVDDMSADQLPYLPHVNRLIGDRGVTFDRAFSPSPLCSPARASILTGRYAHNHGVIANSAVLGGGVRGFRDRQTVPVWLEDAGYKTMLAGKYLNHYRQMREHIPPGWSDWRGITTELNYRDWSMNRNGKQVRFRNRYQTTEMGRQVRNAIARYGPSSRPFFMVASFMAPHTGLPKDADDPRLGTPNVDRRYRNAMASVIPPRPPSFNERDVTDKPLFLRGRPAMRRASAIEAWQQRTESLLSVDDEVASFVRTLRRTGELKNTVIVFASDNGYLLGEHRWRAKNVPYEEASRVPLLARGPGFSPGETSDQIVSLVDLAPTFLWAARAASPRRLDGAPLQRIAADPSFLDDRSVVIEGGGDIVGPTGPLDDENRFYWGIRTPDDKVFTQYATGEREYYNLAVDPFELDNAAGNIGAQRTIKELTDLLTVLRDCRGGSCRAAR